MSAKKPEDVLGYTLASGYNCVTTPDGALCIVDKSKLPELQKNYPGFQVMPVYFWDVMMMLPTGAEYFLDKTAADNWNAAVLRYDQELKRWPLLPTSVVWPSDVPAQDGLNAGIMLRIRLPDFVRERLHDEGIALIRENVSRSQFFKRMTKVWLDIGLSAATGTKP